MRDRTRDYDYAKLKEQEKRHFVEEAVITDELRLGGIHAHGAWTHYWSRVMARLPDPVLGDSAALLARRFPGVRPRILSLGSGYCGEELNLARSLGGACRVRCTDLNGEPFAEAKRRAAAEGLDFEFEEVDLNFAAIESGSWHLILAHASLHHLINLEQLSRRSMGASRREACSSSSR